MKSKLKNFGYTFAFGVLPYLIIMGILIYFNLGNYIYCVILGNIVLLIKEYANATVYYLGSTLNFLLITAISVDYGFNNMAYVWAAMTFFALIVTFAHYRKAYLVEPSF